MPVRQRCQKCRAVKSWSATVCGCGAKLNRYAYLVFDFQGRRFTKTVGRCTRTRAEELLHEWKAQLKQNDTAPPPSLSQVLDAHIEKLKAENKQYWKQVRLFYDRALAYFGDVDPLTITPSKAIQFKTLLDSGSLAPATVDRHIAMTKAAWRTSLWDKPNPFTQVKLNNPDNDVIERLTSDEEARLLKAAEKDISRGPVHLKTIIIIGMNTGLRIEQVLSLCIDETDFENRLIRVTQKGGRQHAVPMNQTLYDALLAIRPESGFYFPNPKTGKQFLRFGKTWRKLKALAKIDPAFRFHGLRHNFATNTLRATGNLAVVRDLLGHSSIKTTEKYAHVLMEDLREAVRKIG